MVQLALRQGDFVNNKFAFSYGNREALFTIIDEEFAGHNRLGRVNRVTILVREFTPGGEKAGSAYCASVIGMGDGVAGVRSDNPGLRGKLLNKDNMEQCVVELYEDGE